ncbi:hypothetical protein GLOIN_2v1503545, partial [Rhizophagus irregularis DAOM 181602=DAOM 197198]
FFIFPGWETRIFVAIYTHFVYIFVSYINFRLIIFKKKTNSNSYFLKKKQPKPVTFIKVRTILFFFSQNIGWTFFVI